MNVHDGQSTRCEAPPEGRNAFAVLMPLVRRVLWAPDGKPPEAWDERREGSVLKRLLVHRTVSQVETAILGLSLLREHGSVPWMAKGSKVTSRALYCTRSGVSQMFELATQEYWRDAKRTKGKKGMQSLGDVLREAMRT